MENSELKQRCFFPKGGSRMNVYLINVQGLTLDKKIEIERIISENGECINMVVVAGGGNTDEV